MLPSGQVQVPPPSLQVTPEVDTRFMVIGTFPPAEISKTIRTVWIDVPAGQKIRDGSNRASVMDRAQIAAGVGVAVGSGVGLGVAGGGVAVGVPAVVVGAVVVEPSLQLTRRHEATTRRVCFNLAPWLRPTLLIPWHSSVRARLSQGQNAGASGLRSWACAAPKPSKPAAWPCTLQSRVVFSPIHRSGNTRASVCRAGGTRDPGTRVEPDHRDLALGRLERLHASSLK